MAVTPEHVVSLYHKFGFHARPCGIQNLNGVCAVGILYYAKHGEFAASSDIAVTDLELDYGIICGFDSRGSRPMDCAHDKAAYALGVQIRDAVEEAGLVLGKAS